MSINECKISVIIPTYNRQRWLSHAIDSVLGQTLPPFEVIVVDDGSSDETAAGMAAYPEIKYIYQPRQGPAAARNYGARLASGNWLAFLDSDDRWTETKLARQIAFLRRHPEMEAVYTDEIWIRNGVRVNQGKRHRKYGGWIYPECLPLCIISPSSIILSRQLWQRSGGFDTAFPVCEDYELWLRLAAQVPIGFIDEPLIIKYGGHADQLSRQWGMDRFRVRALEKMLQQQPPLRPDWRQATLKSLVRRCRILATGFAKHGKPEEAAWFREKAQKWLQRAGKDDAPAGVDLFSSEE